MDIYYEMKTSAKARYTRIAVFPDGRVVLTKPTRVPEIIARQFAMRKSSWIHKRLEFYKTVKFYDWKNFKAADTDLVLAFVKSKIEFFNNHYKFRVGSVRIKNHQKIWGSCSALSNLNFNAKIVAIPLEQAEYIIVHELCHLRELNHSKNFWKLVAQTIPEYKRIKKDLKLYSFY